MTKQPFEAVTVSDALPSTKPGLVSAFSTRMTEAAYDAERAHLRETYGDSAKEAGVRFEQALASLFHRSGWTQEELAKKESKGQSQIDRLLRFGRFLNFTPMGVNPESLPKTLNERRFRKFWDRTEGDERLRFRQVAKLISEEATISAPRRPQIGQAIKDRYADGKWHRLDVIAKKLDTDEAHVIETLAGMSKNQTYNCDVEKKKVGTHLEYRIFSLDSSISSFELIEKLSPIVKELEEQGRKTQVTMSVAAVAILANRLRKLLDEWSK